MQLTPAPPVHLACRACHRRTPNVRAPVLFPRNQGAGSFRNDPHPLADRRPEILFELGVRTPLVSRLPCTRGTPASAPHHFVEFEHEPVVGALDAPALRVERGHRLDVLSQDVDLHVTVSHRLPAATGPHHDTKPCENDDPERSCPQAGFVAEVCGNRSAIGIARRPKSKGIGLGVSVVRRNPISRQSPPTHLPVRSPTGQGRRSPGARRTATLAMR